MGIYQFMGRRYDIATSTFVDSSPITFGFAVCDYQPFPEYRTYYTDDECHVKYTSNNILNLVTEVETVCSKGTDGVKVCLTNSTTDNYFIFHPANRFLGGFRYNGVDYNFCTSAGHSYYKIAAFASEYVEAGTKTASVSLLVSELFHEDHEKGKFWIYGGEPFTSEGANAFKSLVNMASVIDDKYSDIGQQQFYARRYDVSNGIWLDNTYKKYSFGWVSYYPWPQATPQAAALVSHLPSSYCFAVDTTNVGFRINYNLLPSGCDQIRFCLTESTTDNYLYFHMLSVRNGGFVYQGQDHPFIFGSQGIQNDMSFKRYVLSDVNYLDANTGTGTFHQAWINTTPDRGYELVCQNTLGNSLYDFINLLRLAPADRDDPYESGGSSSSGGGSGDFDQTTDDIDIPTVPVVSSSQSGFITLYNPTMSQLQDLATYMWSNPLFDISAWKKIFADPMQAILGLSILPITIPTIGTYPVMVGNLTTDVNMPLVSNQYVTLDCGSVLIKEHWGGYLDYDPYTKLELYLPYCGTHAVSADDIIGKTINVVYHIDVLSGACCSYVKCANSILYSFIGQCATSVPITGDNWTNAINGVLSAAVAIGSFASPAGKTISDSISGFAATASATMSMKPSISRSGAMSGAGGMLAYQKPYFIITRPRQALPYNQHKFTGYPSYITSDLSALSGYTEIEHIRLTGIDATHDELKEIEKLLKEGVIL